MKKFNGFEHGIGMGGWLTNYKRIAIMRPETRMIISPGDMEHFASYITREDIERIASFGADHIRLGFDQIVIEEYDRPYHYREVILEKLDEFFDWCEEFGLNVMFNCHKAIGAYCDCTDRQDLCTDAELRSRFKSMWVMLEKRFHNRRGVAFELLNELATQNCDDWNTLADETLGAIRELNAERYVVMGGAGWNSVHRLNDLKLWDDDRVVYTFHFYEPHEFTHQRGLLQGNQHVYNREMPYPCDMERYREYRRYFGSKTDGDYADFEVMDRRWLWSHLKPAADWIEAHPDKILYNGEFGTIRHAKLEWRIAWCSDVIAFCNKYEIPYSIWNYLSTPYDGNRFSLVDDDDRHILSPEFIKLIKGEVD